MLRFFYCVMLNYKILDTKPRYNIDSEEEYISNLIFEECSVVVIIDENFTEDIINGKEKG